MLAAGCIFFFVSCNSDKDDKGDTKTAAQKNIESSRIISNAFQTGDVSGIDSVVAADFVDHTDRGDVVGRDSLKSIIKMVQNMQMKMSLVKELANDSHVFQWIRFSGRSDGSMGMPAGPYDFTEIEVIRFADGKAVEHWAFMEPRAMMKMGPGGDTTALEGMPTPSAMKGDANSEITKKNLAAMHAISDMFKTKDFSKIGDYMSDDVIDWGGQNGTNKGLAKVKADLEAATQQAGDMKSEVIQEVADEEYVMSWMKFTGTMPMDMGTIKKGDAYTSTAIEVAKYNTESKCTEHWTFMEMREFMKMMGGAPDSKMPPPPPVKSDTVK